MYVAVIFYTVSVVGCLGTATPTRQSLVTTARSCSWLHPEVQEGRAGSTRYLGAREVTCHVSIVTNRASNKTLQFWLANSIVSYSSPSLTLYDLCAGELIVSIYHGSGS